VISQPLRTATLVWLDLPHKTDEPKTGATFNFQKKKWHAPEWVKFPKMTKNYSLQIHLSEVFWIWGNKIKFFSKRVPFWNNSRFTDITAYSYTVPLAHMKKMFILWNIEFILRIHISVSFISNMSKNNLRKTPLNLIILKIMDIFVCANIDCTWKQSDISKSRIISTYFTNLHILKRI